MMSLNRWPQRQTLCHTTALQSVTWIFLVSGLFTIVENAEAVFSLRSPDHLNHIIRCRSRAIRNCVSFLPGHRVGISCERKCRWKRVVHDVRSNSIILEAGSGPFLIVLCRCRWVTEVFSKPQLIEGIYCNFNLDARVRISRNGLSRNEYANTRQEASMKVISTPSHFPVTSACHLISRCSWAHPEDNTVSYYQDTTLR